jgi:hypothetical protein
MLKYGQQFVDKGMEYYEQRYRNQQVNLLVIAWTPPNRQR